MEVGYSRLVTISTDNMLLTNEYRDGVGAHWTFLSDPGRKVQKDLDIAEFTDPEHNPMIPMSSSSNLVSLYSNLQRLLVFWPTDHRRASARLACCVEEMPAGLDITTPELKAAWERVNMIALSLWRQDLRAGVSRARVMAIGLPVLSAESFSGLRA